MLTPQRERERERDFITTTSARHDTTHGEMRKKEHNSIKNSYLEN